jgi:hypothetical protein
MKNILPAIVKATAVMGLLAAAGCSQPRGSKAVAVPVAKLPAQSLAALAQKCQGNFNSLSPADQKTATEMAGNRAPQALQALYQNSRR